MPVEIRPGGLHPDGRMQEVEVEALPLEVLASILTPERARRRSESGGASQCGLLGPHHLARQRDPCQREAWFPAPNPAGPPGVGEDGFVGPSTLSLRALHVSC